MFEVTPILKNGRAEIQLRNGGQSAVVINILVWPERHQRSAISDLSSGQLLRLPPKTAKPVDITKAVLEMIGAAGGENVPVWMAFEIDPNCQRFPARYELDIHDGRVTRLVERYRVH